MKTTKNILRGGVAVSGTLLLVLGSSGASMAATNPLAGLLGGGNAGVQTQVNTGVGNLGMTLTESGSPSLPGLPSVPVGDVVTTVKNAAGDIVTTVTNAAGEVLAVVTTTAGDLAADLTGNLLTGGNPGGNPGGAGGSGSTGGSGVSIGVGTGTGSGGGTGSGSDTSSNSLAYPAGSDLLRAIGLNGASAGTGAAVKTPGTPSGAAKDTLAARAAERTRSIGQGPASDFSWELALIAIGAVGAAGAANIYALRRTRRSGEAAVR